MKDLNNPVVASLFSESFKSVPLAISESTFEKISDIILLIPNIFIWYKDRHSSYQYCNETHAMAAGLDSPKNIQGKTDFSFCWKNRAEAYQKTDRLVMQEGAFYSNEPERVESADGELSMLVTKYRVLNGEHECVGVAGINVDVTDYSFIKKAEAFDEKKHVFYLDDTSGGIYLTNRELSVLKFLVQGYTSKKIGATLKISYRAVEAYIDILKEKMHCSSTEDIVAESIKKGLLHLVADY